MATSLKTIPIPLPKLASVSDATLTNFTQITLDLPESSKVFKSVWLEVVAPDIITVTGGTITETRLALRLNAVAYTTVTNTNDIGNTGENMSAFISADFTSHFTTNWTGTSMTCDVQVYLDQSTGTTLGFRDVTAILWITYEYDDTSATQAYFAFIPFNSSVSALATSKPGTANDTIPNLDSFLGYGSISYKHCQLILEGNEANGGGNTDFTVSVEVDTLGVLTSETIETALATDRNTRLFFNMMSAGSMIFSTNATHSLYWWGSVARFNHAAWTMLVVFTFDATSNNQGNRSLVIPSSTGRIMGGTTSTNANRMGADLYIPESNISTQKSSYRMYFTLGASIAGLNVRAGTQSYVAYTNIGATVAGGYTLQRTIDDNVTLVRGRNELLANIYRTDTADFGWLLSGAFFINYKCDKPTGGWGAANRTVGWNIFNHSTTAAVTYQTSSSIGFTIPETNYFISNIGLYSINLSSNITGIGLDVERKSTEEDGPDWDECFVNLGLSDAEIGYYTNMQSIHRNFWSFPSDIRRYKGDAKLDFETARLYRFYNSTSAYKTASMLFTYHSITFTVESTISNSAGGTVTCYLVLRRGTDSSERMQKTTRVGNGLVSFTWYDDTSSVFVEAIEDNTHLGRSIEGTAE